MAPCQVLPIQNSNHQGHRDFREYSVESFSATSGFDRPDWQVAFDGTSAGEISNSDATILFTDESILNKRITGTVDATNGSNEDDIFGFVLGFNAGDTTNSDAEYLLLDWKGDTQGFDFTGSMIAKASLATLHQFLRYS